MKKPIIGVVIMVVAVMCVVVAISGPSAPEYKVETSVADHGSVTCIQATVRGESGGLTLYLSDPSKNTVDQAHISDGEMADGVETKYLALMGPIGGVGTTATPGTYTLVIVNLHGDTVHEEEFTFGGANVSIIGCDPVYYLGYVGYYLDRLTITGRNDGDLTAYIGGVYVSINGQEGSSLIGAGDVTDLGGGDFTVEAKNFFLGPFSEGTYTMTLTMRTEPLGGGEVLATYTTTIDVAVVNVETPPVADAGGPYSVNGGESITLDGAASYDPDGTIVSYSWTIVSGPGSLTDADTAAPMFNAPLVEENTLVTVELTVTDNGGLTGTDSATITSSTTPTSTPEIVLAGYTSSPVSSAYLDYFYLDDVEITLRNEGNAPAEVYKLILVIGGEECTSSLRETLDPNEEAEFTINCYGSVLGLGTGRINREIETYLFNGRLEVQDSDYQTLLEQDLTFTIPTLGMGDTLPEVKLTDNISFTPLWWVESGIAVVDWGDEMTGHDYWTFTAKSGMKFVIFAFKLKNNSIRVQETPYMNAGEIATDQGYIYLVWDSPSPYYSESDEYNPRESTEEEINNLIGDSATLKKLLQGESVVGCVVFEIPEWATPLEANLGHIAPLIIF